MNDTADYPGTLQSLLHTWIEHKQDSLIVEALSCSDLSGVDLEDVVRCCVKHHNHSAFDVVIAYAQQHLPTSTYDTILTSAVWDSVVHNNCSVFERYFLWHSSTTTLNEWHQRLYMHCAKNSHFEFLKRLDNGIELSHDTWNIAVLASMGIGHTQMFSYLMERPVNISALDAMRWAANVAVFSPNVSKILPVVFEHISLNDILNNATSAKKDEIIQCYAQYEEEKARAQRETLGQNIDLNTTTHKRKL